MEYKIVPAKNDNGDSVFQVVDQDGAVKSEQAMRRDAVNDIKLLNAEGPEALSPKAEGAEAETPAAPGDPAAEDIEAALAKKAA